MRAYDARIIARTTARLAGAALVGLAAACSDDPTGPSGPLQATLTGPAQITAEFTEGFTRCDYAVKLAVQGGAAGEQVTLEKLRLEWRLPNGQPIPGHDPEDVPAAELADDWFETVSVSRGQQLTADRWVSATPHQEFQFVHTLTYRVGNGAPQTASYTLTCK